MKKYLFGTIAVVLAVASVAFTRPVHKTTTGTYWFPTNTSGQSIPYVKSDNMPYTTQQLGCNGAGAPCEIVNTDFSADLQEDGYLISPEGEDQSGTLKNHN